MKPCLFSLILMVLITDTGHAQFFFQGDFESGDLSGWGTELCCPYSAEVVTSPVRAGNYAVRFTLNDTDPLVATSYRAELKLEKEPPRSERWYGFSVYLPSSYVSDDEPEIIAQWHAFPDFDLGETWRSPPLELHTVQGYFFLSIKWDSRPVTPGNSLEGRETFFAGRYETDVWVDWVVHAKWSWESDGLIEVWKDGELVIRWNGPNTYNDEKGIYFKMGIYKWPWKNPDNQSIVHQRVLYHDEVRVGDETANYAKVAPRSTPFFVTAGPDRFSCEPGDSFRLGGAPTADGGVEPYSYAWEPSQGLSCTDCANPTASPTATETYTVRVTDASQNEVVDSVTIQVETEPLLAHWRVEEGAGTTLQDSVGGQNGTIVGASWLPTDQGPVLRFDGGNDYVAVPDFPPPSNLTVTAWIYPDGSEGNARLIVSKHPLEYDFGLDENGFLTGFSAYRSITDSSFDFTTPDHERRWYHVAFVHDASEGLQKIYRDGICVATGENRGPISDEDTMLWIGRDVYYDSGTFAGKLDDIRLYRCALPPEEIHSLYLQGRSSKIHLWRLY